MFLSTDDYEPKPEPYSEYTEDVGIVVKRTARQLYSSLSDKDAEDTATHQVTY